MDFSLGPYVVEVATEFGPRLTGLRLGDGRNVLAELPPEVTVGPSDDPFRFRGGHRVWAAPEEPEITYAPDEEKCTIDVDGDTVTIVAPADRVGIVKEITISLSGESLVVVNRLSFTRELGRRIAPWAITQFPYGGTAIMPVSGESTAPLPNRRIVLWPYTSLTDPRISLSDHAVSIEASGEVPLKMGSGPAPGRLGYWRRGELFVKEVESAGKLEIPDMGAVGQVYVGAGFCELESMGGLSAASEGSVVSIEEVWRLMECPDLDTALELTAGSR